MPHLEQLHALYQALRARATKRGALDFDAPEIKVRLDAEGSVAALEVHARNDAHRLIEECMIAANIEAARFLKKHRMPTLYRVHGAPEERKGTSCSGCCARSASACTSPRDRHARARAR